MADGTALAVRKEDASAEVRSLALEAPFLRWLVYGIPLAILAGALAYLGSAELLAFSPQIILVVAAMMMPLAPRRVTTNAPLAWASTAALAAAFAVTLDMLAADIFGLGGISVLGGARLSIASASLSVDAFSLTFNLVFIGVGILVALASITDEVQRASYPGIYFMLLLLTIVGTMVVASATSLITVFLGLELAGIATYAMVAFVKTNKLSSEAAVKYYIIGSSSTALVIFGMSYLYGITGSLDLATISQRLSGVSLADSGVVLALAFLVAGFGFKMAAVPFHLWAPDTYVGAPSPVSALLAAGTKKMGFVAAFKVIVVGMIAVKAEWTAMFAILAVVTMTFGNVAALRQESVKRMLAYSSIAQAGYILVALAIAGSVATQTAVAAGVFHSLTHMIMKAGAFIGLGMLVAIQIGDNFEDIKGLSRRAPVSALAMLIFMLSLAGIPLFAGFASKFYISAAGAEAGSWYLLLVILLWINSAISLYYYARVIINMYLRDPPEGAGPIREPTNFKVALGGAAFLIMAIGVFPEPVFRLSVAAAQALLTGI